MKFNIPLITDLQALVPDESYDEVLITSILPALGTLMTRLRAEYLDGKMHSPSFEAYIVGMPASGKSFAEDISDILMRGINQSDLEAFEVEREYLERVRLSKNSAQQPIRPTTIIRQNSETQSNTKLLMRMQAAGGAHLYTFSPESDAIQKSAKRGAWSEIDDIRRKAFDNSVCSQDNMVEGSWSGRIRIYWNMLLTGTPNSMHRRYPVSSVESGNVSRTIFSQMPYKRASKMPVWKKPDEAMNQRIDRWLNHFQQVTFDAEGHILPEIILRLDYLNQSMTQWLDRQRQQIIDDNDDARDCFYKRAAVNGFRAGMMAHYLIQSDTTLDDADRQAEVVRFAHYVADFSLRSLLQLFKDDFDNAFRLQLQHSAETPQFQLPRPQAQPRLIDTLPDTFTRDDIVRQQQLLGQTTEVSKVISRWRQQQLITTDPDGITCHKTNR